MSLGCPATLQPRPNSLVSIWCQMLPAKPILPVNDYFFYRQQDEASVSERKLHHGRQQAVVSRTGVERASVANVRENRADADDEKSAGCHRV
jgi:hypothetical protein